MISFQKTIPYYYYYLVHESKKMMQGKIIVSSSSSSVSHHRYCNLQRNSEALKAKKDTHTYAHIHEHTPHEEHWHTYAHIHEHTPHEEHWHTYAHIHEHRPHEEHLHTYAHIHEHTLTQHMKNIGTYTTHTHSRERVLAGIHHAYNKYTFSHTRYAHNTQNKFKDTGTYSLTTQKNNTL
jgi:hypothetical protein